MKLICPLCEQHLEVADEMTNQDIRCPACREPIEVSSPMQGSAEQSDGTLIADVDLTLSFSPRENMTLTEFMTRQGSSEKLDLGGESVDSVSSILQADPVKRYDHGSEISRGGMGAILDARDVNIRRRVAMKVMLDPRSVSEEQVLRFIEEAQITGQLEHPGIVPIYELGLDSGGNVFYTMKFIAGVTLKDVINGKLQEADGVEEAFPLSRLLTIFQTICDAIGYAHSKGVVHRDLKPENVMIGEYGEVLVLDWGLAKVLDESRKSEPAPRGPAFMSTKEIRSATVSSARREFGERSGTMHTMVGDVMGTPAYMSPEQATGEIDKIDQRTDIYSLGAILYNILTLKAPIQGGNLNEVLANARAGSIVSIESHDRPVPPSLSAVCLKSLALGREDRYQTVNDLQRDISAYQNGFATSAEEAGLWKQLNLFVKRNKVATGMSALVMFCIILGGVVAGLQWKKAEQETAKARSALEELRGTAPALVALADSFYRKRDYDRAVKTFDYAVRLRNNDAKTRLKKAHLLQGLWRLEEAARVYEEVLEIEPDNASAEANLELCSTISDEPNQGEKPNPLDVLRVYHAIRDQGRVTHAAMVIEHFSANGSEMTDFWKSYFVKLDMPPVKMTLDEDGVVRGVSFMKMGNQIKSLDPISGLPLHELDLKNTGVESLSPLIGMPLKILNISGCPVADFGPLQPLPLTHLDLNGNGNVSSETLSRLPWDTLRHLGIASTSIDTLSPLKGTQIESLNISKTKIDDLTPLQGLPLKSLIISETRVRDLSALQGLELEILSLSHTNITDILPLRGMPLQTLDLENSKVDDISAIKGMNLIFLNLTGLDLGDYSPVRSQPSLQFVRGYAEYKTLLDMIRSRASERTPDEMEADLTRYISMWSMAPVFLQSLHQAHILRDVAVEMLEPGTMPASAASFNGHHYYGTSKEYSVSEAKALAKRLGGHLLTITSEEENRFISELVRPLKRLREPNDNRGRFFFGIIFDENEKPQWITGEKWSYGGISKVWGKELGVLTLRPKEEIAADPAKSPLKWEMYSGNNTWQVVIEWDR